MDLYNHPSLYSGGNVKLDSTPSTNLYIQLQQKRKAQQLAKEDAFSDYINNLNTKITPAGVRVSDLPAFEQMKNEWQEYGMKNKAALQKNDIPTQTEFNNKYQKLINLTMRSKAEEEKKKPYVEILVDPVKRGKTSSRLINDMQVHDQPLFVKNANGEWEENRTRKGLDIADNYFNPQFDFDKEFTGWSKGLQPGKTYSDKPIKSDPQSGTVTFGTEEKFTPEQILQTANNAMKAIKSDGEGRNFYQHKLENIADEDLKLLNKAFQSAYGATTQYTFPNGNTVTGENVIDTPEELAAAEAIMQAQSMIKKGEELRPDKALANQRAQVNINLNRGDGGGVAKIEGNEFDRLASDLGIGENANSDSLRIEYKSMPEQLKAILKSGGIDINGMSYYTANIKNGRIQSITPYWTTKEGELKSEGSISRQDMENAQLKYNAEPQKGQQPKFGEQGAAKNEYEKTQSGTYNGKKVTIGFKNGKWYDTSTRKEIK